MSQIGTAECNFDVGETHDGQRRLIEIKPKKSKALINQGSFTLELNQGFEQGDAETLARMLKNWITQIHFEPLDN